MMSFCKKSVHSFLGLTIPMNVDHPTYNNITAPDQKPSSKCLGDGVLSSGGGSSGGGLGLITATSDPYKTPNVLEAATVKTSLLWPFIKKDPGGIGFIDDVGGGVNGLMSCTESLGCESCDERRVDDEMDELCINNKTRSLPAARTNKVVKWRKLGERREVKKFPPPLSSFNHNGQPSFFLRPVRRDGRLELTEVRIDRPEILRAHREDGRLRLHLIRDDEEPHYQVQAQEQEAEEGQEQEDRQDFEEEEVEEDEEERGEEWRFPVTGEGFRRCHELVPHHHDYHHHHHHHHHNLHVWSQHCVTTR